MKGRSMPGVSICCVLSGAALALALSMAPVRAETVTGAPLSPVASALSVAIESQEDLALTRFYAARTWAPVWLTGSGQATGAARALLAAIDAAPSHGLPVPASAAALAARVAEADGLAPGQAARLERDLTRLFLAHARARAAGLIRPRSVDRMIDIDRPLPEERDLLARLAQARDVTALLRDLAPDHPDYAALRERLARFRALVAAGGWGAEVPDGPTLREGDSGPRVAALRARLAALGDLDRDSEAAGGTVVLAANEVVRDLPAGSGTGADPSVFDPALGAALRRFQARHGLNEDGLLGPRTLAALNRSAAYRLRQIAANLERLRWTNRPPGARHIAVNIAGFRVALVEQGREVFSARVVVGTPRHPTAEFSDEMEYLVVNPYWNVPRSIRDEEILPKLKRDPEYLIKNDMEIVGLGVPSDSIAWEYVRPIDFPGRVRQRPGRGNALGRVKFMFPNEHSIYLHDTPQRHLFARDARAYSHGCIRVMKPLELAHRLLAGQVEDPEARFAAWRRRDREIYVHLDTPLPVHLTYRTAPVDPDGPVQFRGDIYGRDRAIARALAEAGLDLPPA